ncbi:transposase (fragment) [Tepidanaerobacter acetatoxydans Re1]|uniref:Transposase n=1 Tax=Tepidanaerobacter acetatoxydans (strain DSM 21804 / JCM 16047 / Re1) TaxID=1209989 RepID=L0S1I4_TEPAE
MARRHNISPNKRGSVNPLPKSEAKRIQEIENRLEAISKENNTIHLRNY